MVRSVNIYFVPSIIMIQIIAMFSLDIEQVWGQRMCLRMQGSLRNFMNPHKYNHYSMKVFLHHDTK